MTRGSNSFLLLLPLLLLILIAEEAMSLPTYQGQIPNGGRVPCPPSGTTGGCGSDGLCAGVGHLSCAGGGERNAFGLAFAAANHQWTKELCQADADGDGFTNGEELGDPCCAWQAGSSAAPSQGINGATHPGFKSSLPTAHTLSTCPSSPPSAAGPPPPAATSARPANAFLPNEPQFEKTFIIKPFAVPAEETTYIWSQFDFPECSNQSCYVIGVDIINNNTKVLHHIIATLCPARYNASLDGTLAPPFMDCANLLAEWAPGREPMMAAHDFASLPIGASFNKPVGSLMLQFHYNNPSLLAGLRDTSGIRVYYTTQPREQNLGELLAIQLTIDGSLSIPARRNRHYLGMICEIRGLSRPITPTEMWYHAHLLGREFHSFVKPADGSPMYELYRDARWSFANQNMVDVIARNLSLHNGDVLLTVAVFNSTERSENTIIGFETTAEMFWHGLMYYPYQTGTSCPGRLMQGDLEPCEDPLDVIKSRLALPAPFDGLVPYQAIKTIKVHACDYEAVAAITNFSDLMARADDCFRSSFRSNSACTRLWSSIRDCACPNYPGTEQIPPSQLAVLQNYSRQFLNSMDPCLSPDAFASTMGCANTTVGYDVWTLQTCDYATNFTKPFIAAYSIPQVCTKVPTLAPEPVTVKVSGATDPNVFRTTLILGALLVFVLMVSLQPRN